MNKSSPGAALDTCSAAGGQVGPALQTLSVPQLVAHVVAEVVVAGPTHLVALGAVVVLVAAHSDGVFQAGAQALVLHRLLVLAGADQPFVDAALDQQLLIWTRDTTSSNARHKIINILDVK